MTGFHEVRFPLRLSLGTSGGPELRTDIVSLTNGRESRNRRWAAPRRRYDAGTGIRSLADLQTVIAFFQARGGPLNGFRFRDPFDWHSGAPGLAPGPFDQRLAEAEAAGSGVYPLSKTYGDAGGALRRLISKPVAGSVAIAVDGVVQPAAAYDLDPATGLVAFHAGHRPAAAATVTAGFEFDVPVRFDTERIEASLAAFDAGRIPAVPLIEIWA